MEDSSSMAPLSKRLEGKVALITGGASGIGEATVRLFVKHGAQVVIADIQDELGLALCENIVSNTQVSYIHCDVTNERDIQEAIDTVITKYNKLDIMFSNAGIVGNFSSTISTFDVVDLKRVFEVNVFGAFFCAKHAARVMIPLKKGCILFTASVASEVAGLIHHAYTSSKHAVVGLMKNLCVELGQHGIRVNCISPHATITPMVRKSFPLSEEKLEEVLYESGNLRGAVSEVADVAEAALYLASDASKYMSGHNLVIDGGYSTTNPTFVATVNKALS